MIRTLLGLFSLLLTIPLSAAQPDSYADKVVVIEVGESDLVNAQSFKFWQRTLERLNQEKAQAVIFQLDTPGGLAIDTKNLMVEDLRDLEIPSYAFVDDEAISAGAMISVATDEIWMSPGSTIGAAAIVSGTGVEIEATMRAKLESFFEANIRAVTADKGYPTEIVKMMMFIEDEPREYGPISVGKGKLLTLTAEEAVQQHNGQPILATGIAKDRDDLIQQLGFAPSDVVVAEQTGFELFAWHISAWSSLLILIGIGGIYFEVKSPGFGLGASVAAIAFGIFFFGNFMAGKLAGYELVGLFVLGLILIIIEVALFPNLILGFIGTCLMIGSLLFSMVDRFDFRDLGTPKDIATEDTISWGDLLLTPLQSLSIGLLGGIILIMLLMKFLPKYKIPGIVLSREIGAGGSFTMEDQPTAQKDDHVIGQEGVATMDLRPAGKMSYGTKTLEVITNGEFIEKGTPVKIVAIEQMRTVVERV